MNLPIKQKNELTLIVQHQLELNTVDIVVYRRGCHRTTKHEKTKILSAAYRPGASVHTYACVQTCPKMCMSLYKGRNC
jgi:hypothetical protein